MNKILIVEDELIVAKDIECQLTEQGYLVTDVVKSGPAAIRSMEEQRPDLVLLDIYLEGDQSGIDVAHIAHDDFDIPVVFLSAYSDSGLLREAREAGPYGYVVKPFQEPALRAAIEIALFKHSIEQSLIESREQLANEKALLAVTLRSIGEGVITTDANWCVQLLNPVAEQITEQREADCLGRPIEQVLSAVCETDGAPIREALRGTALGGTAVHDCVATLSVANAPEKVLSIRAAALLDQQNRSTGCVIAFRDITRQREAERELLKAERLDALGVLAGGIAHDFNNLLTSVIGGVTLAKAMLQTSNDAVVDVLSSVESVLPTATDLAGQLLAFAKGDEPVKARTNLAVVLEELVPLTLLQQTATYHLDIDSSLWFASVDVNQIRRVVSNLVLNASQAMPGGGEVRVCVRNATLTTDNDEALPQGRYIVVSIEDEGVGIDPETISKVFDPYFSTKSGGQGLGLAVSYSIVKRHHGTILVDSIPSEGTRFRVFLPASNDGPIEQELPPKKTRTVGGRGLVMDDQPAIRKILGQLLMHLKYTVVTTADGPSTIDAYKSGMNSDNPFDIVILDLTLPGGMGGADVVKELLLIDPDVRAIVTTGYYVDPVIAEHKKFGFKACLKKPFDLEQLQEALQTAFDEES